MVPVVLLPHLRVMLRWAIVNGARRRFILASVKFLSRALTALELRSINDHACHPKQVELAAQHAERATYLANGRAVVLSEVGNGLEVGCELPGQPDHFDVGLALSLKAPARRPRLRFP
jgi:hypothetical protein